MERHDFYQSVEQQAALADEADARDATHAVLSALGERLDDTRSQRLDGELPSELGEQLAEGPSGRSLSYDEFLDRVETQTDRADTGDPEAVSQAVVGTLLEHVDEDEADDLRDRLEAFGYEATVPESGPGAGG
ncbi:DUF2267 domain-containing protein [Natrinema versiforme]|uniref:DUF2267 domain-containing protein n=1 Tax=Natrinema versiforme TaxID=88724 RepID=A0A4V1FXG8_9EURY|nr:DUF2267 domain-containing protein [Natrinema versiforme]QCS40969.1 DUF2267 domain-containing protein [Natrinema versiforme]